MARYAAGMPRGISFRARAEKWFAGARCDGLRAGAVHASLRDESRDSVDAISQYGADVSADRGRRCGPAYESVSRGGEGDQWLAGRGQRAVRASVSLFSSA